MQLTLSLEEFNIFLMIYMKSIVTGDVDYNKGLLEGINASGNAEAKILFEERAEAIDNHKWDSTRERVFNDQIHVLLPDLNMKLINEFDDFVELLEDRNIKTWLIQRFYRQNPKLRLYLKRFIDKIENDEEFTLRLIL